MWITFTSSVSIGNLKYPRMIPCSRRCMPHHWLTHEAIISCGSKYESYFLRNVGEEHLNALINLNYLMEGYTKKDQRNGQKGFSGT